VRRIGSFPFFFFFATKGVGKAARYNDTKYTYKRATYCILHDLLSVQQPTACDEASVRIKSGRQRVINRARHKNCLISTLQSPMDQSEQLFQSCVR